MNAEKFAELLVDLHACTEATTWAEGKSLAEAWTTCKRGDWLLWLCGKMADKPGWPTRKEVVLAACDCAELALKHVPAGEERSRRCIETVRAWASGTASILDVQAARRCAAAASSAAAAASAAAAYAAADAASADAAYAAADAAYAAAAYAAAAYAAAGGGSRARARTETLAECAKLVRERLSVPVKGVR